MISPFGAVTGVHGFTGLSGAMTIAEVAQPASGIRNVMNATNATGRCTPCHLSGPFSQTFVQAPASLHQLYGTGAACASRTGDFPPATSAGAPHRQTAQPALPAVSRNASIFHRFAQRSTAADFPARRFPVRRGGG